MDADESRAFFEHGCGCRFHDGQLCSSGFSKDHYCLICDQCTSFECPALNNILFGHAMATTITNELCGIQKSKDYRLRESMKKGRYGDSAAHACLTTFCSVGV